MSTYKTLGLAAAIATLAGCASIPQPLQGTYTQIDTSAAQQGGAGGSKVRWGGEIISTEPGPQETCFYMLSRPLDSQARPKSSHDVEGQGRFVACRAGFYDPEVFARGREVTVTGTLHGTVSKKVGDFDYAYPRIEADVVYLWPERTYVQYPPGYYDPFWGPGWGPYWGGGWGYPYYYQPRVIVVPRPVPPAPRPHG
ncbi:MULTISPECIES: Slp family lipoprotein [Dyella]|uniref:Slp family lipoprotein n=2 Tax=Dyella TaxID=231454 RepID=A0A4R0Z0T0_9GAMM|nr:MULTISPECIES: Slp family lipoprotein [Dyella]TBR39179.1 Slp family lipoprotein [Dyella terrae]TCI13234.1 Slp family lipoprotein [Dyella soli]